MGVTFSGPTILICDNKSAIQIAHNDVFLNKTYRNSLTHLGHFVRHHFLQGSMPYISSELQIADLLTKSHTTVGFRYLVSKLQILSLEASWVWGGGVKHIDSVSSVYSKWVLLYIALSLFLMLFYMLTQIKKEKKEGDGIWMNSNYIWLTILSLSPFFRVSINNKGEPNINNNSKGKDDTRRSFPSTKSFFSGDGEKKVSGVLYFFLPSWCPH